jgi:hypothetical protein
VNGGIAVAGAVLLAAPALWAQTGRVRFQVKDPAGSPVSHAEVFLLGSRNKPIASVEANDAGEIVWTHLPWRDCHFQVSKAGFHNSQLTVTVRNSDEQLVQVTLQAGIEDYFEVYPPNASRPARHRWWQIFR